MSDTDVTAIMDHFDPASYRIRYTWHITTFLFNDSSSVYTVYHHRKVWGLNGTCQQKHTVQSIAAYVDDINKLFPEHGAETIRKALLLTNKIHVPRCVLHLRYE
jgi:hypothetical protein